MFIFILCKITKYFVLNVTLCSKISVKQVTRTKLRLKLKLGFFENKKGLAEIQIISKSLTLLLPVTPCVGHDIDLASSSNISKTDRVNVAFTSI